MEQGAQDRCHRPALTFIKLKIPPLLNTEDLGPYLEGEERHRCPDGFCATSPADDDQRSPENSSLESADQCSKKERWGTPEPHPEAWNERYSEPRDQELRGRNSISSPGSIGTFRPSRAPWDEHPRAADGLKRGANSSSQELGRIRASAQSSSRELTAIQRAADKAERSLAKAGTTGQKSGNQIGTFKSGADKASKGMNGLNKSMKGNSVGQLLSLLAPLQDLAEGAQSHLRRDQEGHQRSRCGSWTGGAT